MTTKLQITKAPKTKPAKNEDGVATGMLVTLAESVALVNGKETVIPAGELITKPISGGYSQHVGGMSECRQRGTDGAYITYRTQG